MLDERLANRPIDFDQSIDDGWLNRCNITQLGQDGELSYFRLHDPVSRQAWIAVRAPLEAPAACQRLERDYRLQLDPQWAVIPSAFVRCAEGPLLVYPTGRSIADLISEGPVDLPLFFDIAVNAADALAQAHERNVLHGALQPEHVCLQANQRVRLGCFRADTPELISEQGNALGNWAYLAPEQICPPRQQQRPAQRHLRPGCDSLPAAAGRAAAGRAGCPALAPAARRRSATLGL